jgi:hypothetical protein
MGKLLARQLRGCEPGTPPWKLHWKSDSRLLFLESDGPLTIATVHGVVFHFFGAPNRRLEQEQN